MGGYEYTGKTPLSKGKQNTGDTLLTAMPEGKSKEAVDFIKAGLTNKKSGKAAVARNLPQEVRSLLLGKESFSSMDKRRKKVKTGPALGSKKKEREKESGLLGIGGGGVPIGKRLTERIRGSPV